MNIYSAKNSKTNLNEPSIFVVYPELESGTFESLTELEKYPSEDASWKAFYKHPNGAEKITDIIITSSDLNINTKTIKAVNGIENLTVKSGKEHVMELHFDNDIQGKSFDLRPELPLIMQTFSFNHIALSVKDVNESVAFYQKVLELKEIENTASNSKTRWLAIGDGKQLHLIPRPNAKIKTNKAVHFALTTSNLDSFIEHLKALKINYSDWTNTPNKDYIRKDGIKQVYFQDPNGYWIEINNDI